MEINWQVTIDAREQAALQAALVTHGAPECLMTLALNGRCRIVNVEEAKRLRRWLADTRVANQNNVALLNSLERDLIRFGV